MSFSGWNHKSELFLPQFPCDVQFEVMCYHFIDTLELCCRKHLSSLCYMFKREIPHLGLETQTYFHRRQSVCGHQTGKGANPKSDVFSRNAFCSLFLLQEEMPFMWMRRDDGFLKNILKIKLS